MCTCYFHMKCTYGAGLVGGAWGPKQASDSPWRNHVNPSKAPQMFPCLGLVISQTERASAPTVCQHAASSLEESWRGSRDHTSPSQAQANGGARKPCARVSPPHGMPRGSEVSGNHSWGFHLSLWGLATLKVKCQTLPLSIFNS